MRNRSIDRGARTARIPAAAPRVGVLLLGALLFGGAAPRAPAAEPSSPPATPAAALSVLQCGHLIDTAAGRMLGATTVVVEGKRVRDVLSGMQSPAGATVIDLQTQTCMPGLIDSHTHLTEETSPTALSWTSSTGTSPTTPSARPSTRAAPCWPASRRCATSATGRTNRWRCATRSTPASFRGRASSPPAGRSVRPAATPIPPTAIAPTSPAIPVPRTASSTAPEDAVKAVRQHYKHGDDLIKIMPSGGVLDESASGDNAQMTHRGNPRRRRDRARLRLHGRRARARRRGHSPRGDRRRRFDRARHVHGRRGHEADEGARHLVRADHHRRRLRRAAGQAYPATTRRRSRPRPRRSARSIQATAGTRLQGAREDCLRHRCRGVSARRECA